MNRENVFRRAAGAVKAFGFKQWFLLILNIVLVIGSAASLVGMRAIAGTLTSLTAARQFRGESEMRFAQVACYLPVGQETGVNEIYQFRSSLDGKFQEQSLEAPENGSLYVDAYSAAASVSAEGPHGSATVQAVAVGGDFFYFHPLELKNGSYFSDDDLMDDLVLLDEELAWRLFGGSDLAGMEMTLNGETFIVSGVVARESDFASRKAYSGEPGLFMSYSALERLKGDGDGTISCYEIVLPDPISGYALGVVEDGFPVGQGDVVENSARYTLGHLFSVLGSFGQRSMRLNGVIYPYWENAARLTEDYAAGLLLLAILLAICPLCFALVIGIREIIQGYRFMKRTVPAKVEGVVERSREKRLEKKFKKKDEGQ